MFYEEIIVSINGNNNAITEPNNLTINWNNLNHYNFKGNIVVVEKYTK